MEGQNCWDRYDCLWKVLWIGLGYRSDRDLVPILPVESECMPWVGIECVEWSLAVHSLMGGN